MTRTVSLRSNLVKRTSFVSLNGGSSLPFSISLSFSLSLACPVACMFSSVKCSRTDAIVFSAFSSILLLKACALASIFSSAEVSEVDSIVLSALSSNVFFAINRSTFSKNSFASSSPFCESLPFPLAASNSFRKRFAMTSTSKATPSRRSRTHSAPTVSQLSTCTLLTDVRKDSSKRSRFWLAWRASFSATFTSSLSNWNSSGVSAEYSCEIMLELEVAVAISLTVIVQLFCIKLFKR